jgi:hypothetical protein
VAFWDRFLALLQGEVPASTLEIYRRTGILVYEALDEAEGKRLEIQIQGLSPWSLPIGTQTYLLSVWNAFTLQTLGDQFLDTDYQCNPATAGYVPARTAQQILIFYNQVEPWLTRAHQARNDPAYQLDIPLPAALPWLEIESYPLSLSHVEGLMTIARSLRVHVEGAMATFESLELPPYKQSSLDQLRQLLGKSTSQLDYAEQLWENQIAIDQVQEYAKATIDCYYQLGQLLAMPQLVKRIAPRKRWWN